MVMDALRSRVTRSSMVMVLTMLDQRALVQRGKVSEISAFSLSEQYCDSFLFLV